MSSIRYGLAPRHDALLTSGCVIAGLLLGQWTVSQWLAELFDGQAALGRPWFHVGELAIYAPWAWVRWAPHLPALHLERQPFRVRATGQREGRPYRPARPSAPGPMIPASPTAGILVFE